MPCQVGNKRVAIAIRQKNLHRRDIACVTREQARQEIAEYCDTEMLGNRCADDFAHLAHTLA